MQKRNQTGPSSSSVSIEVIEDVDSPRRVASRSQTPSAEDVIIEQVNVPTAKRAEKTKVLMDLSLDHSSG